MRAVFLDRDGCLNDDWFNPATGAWESPISPADLILRPGVIGALRALDVAGWALFVVSNQPSFAKGKCTLEDLRAVHARFAALVSEAGLSFRDVYYSYHHPRAVIPAYAGPSPDRKPNPHFLRLAADRHGVDLAASWMVGDRDTDVEFGRRGGVRTIQVANPRAGAYAGRSRPDYHAENLAAAADIIILSAARGPTWQP
jgi:D-glycero-D-manno-heptose 1,7-bisphosphate phosphatase